MVDPAIKSIELVTKAVLVVIRQIPTVFRELAALLPLYPMQLIERGASIVRINLSPAQALHQFPSDVLFLAAKLRIDAASILATPIAAVMIVPVGKKEVG
jgi:hypothetical protein